MIVIIKIIILSPWKYISTTNNNDNDDDNKDANDEDGGSVDDGGDNKDNFSSPLMWERVVRCLIMTMILIKW